MSTAAERKVVEYQKARHEEMEKLQAWHDKRIAKAVMAVLKKGCTHPVGAHEEFEWQHDDGYGTQTPRSGRHCCICDKVNHYPGSANWSVRRDCD